MGTLGLTGLAVVQIRFFHSTLVEHLMGLMLLCVGLALFHQAAQTDSSRRAWVIQPLLPWARFAAGVGILVMSCLLAAYVTQHLASLSGSEFLWYLCAIAAGGLGGYVYSQFSHKVRRQQAPCQSTHMTSTADAAWQIRLQHLQSRMAFITESFPVGMLEADATGRCHYLTSTCADLLGVSFLDAYIGSWFDHVLSEDRGELIKSWQTSLERSEPFSMECRVRAGDGGIRWIHVRCRPLVDDFGAVYVGTIEDITQQRRSARQLQKTIESLDFLRAKEQEKSRLLEDLVLELEQEHQRAAASCQAKSHFLANMSHEIRTPMTAILGFTDVLIEDADTSPTCQSALQTIRRNAEYLLSLLDDILDLSKIEAGRLELERVRLSPRVIVEDVSELMQVRLRNKPHVQLLQSISSRVPVSLVTDPTRLKQVLMNLVGNAIKFTERGSVSILVDYAPVLDGQTTAGHLVIEVKDTGIGISPDQVSRLYQPFGQAEVSTTRRFGGTGLGLAICKHIVEALNGSISVESDVDVGTIFRVVIPAVDPYFETSALSSASPQKLLPSVHASVSTVPLAHARILLAEDGLDNQRLLKFVLTKAGAKVTIVENGQQAVTEILQAAPSNQPYDLVLMDMQMPVMDGYTATRQLRSAGYRNPIVALTAHAMHGDREKCLAAGCNEYECKPIQQKSLLETLHRLLHETPISGDPQSPLSTPSTGSIETGQAVLLPPAVD